MKSELHDPEPTRTPHADAWRSLMEQGTHTLTKSKTVDESSSSSSHPSESASDPDDSVHADAPQLGPLPLSGYIQHYEIIRELGEGGMGIVLLARDTKLGRLVAIKLLHDSGQAAARLRAEAQATARARVTTR